MAATTEAREDRPARRLIINADDFGFTPGVTAGILEAHAAGSVTSTSMMVHCPGWMDAVRRARDYPTLGIGLHFNLLVGVPLTPATSLCRADGAFLSLGALTRRALAGTVRTHDVRVECEAQLDALADAGIRATHIDSHRHTHALPGVHAAVAGIAAARGLPLRRPIEGWHPLRRRPAGWMRDTVVAWSWRAASMDGHAARAADHFAGLSLQGRRQFGSGLARLLDALPPGTTELMVHPGRVDEALAAVDPYTWQREIERDVLTGPALSERLRRGDLVLTSFGAL